VIILTLLTSLGGATLALRYPQLKATLAASWQQNAQESLANRTKKLISSFEQALQSNLLLRYPLIDLHGLYQRLMGRRSVEDSSGQMVLQDSYANLHFLYWEQDTAAPAAEYVKFYYTLREMALPLLYVQLPNKVIPGYTELPKPMTNNSNLVADAFLERLAAQQLPYLDLRPRLWQSGIPYKDMFYRTDHHWQTPTAFWAAMELVAYLEESLHWELPSLSRDLKDYRQETYTGIFLGSQGRRTGRFYTGVDDFTIIYPYTDGSYSLYADGYAEPLWTGSFRQTFLREEHLAADKPITHGRYGTFLEYDMGLVHIINHDLQEGKRVLLIKDSFSLAMAPFLAQFFQELYLIDLRAFTQLPLELLPTIAEIAPDLVMVVYNTEVFSEVMFTFE